MSALQEWLRSHNKRMTQEAIDEALMEYITSLETKLERYESALVVRYEYCTYHAENTSTPGWGEWEEVKARLPSSTVEDAVSEIKQFVNTGYPYQLRELIVKPEVNYL